MYCEWSRISILGSLLVLGFLLGLSLADQNQASRDNLREPVFRVAKQPKLAKVEDSASVPLVPDEANDTDEKTDDHPLDPVLKLARESLALIDATISDYTCTLIKRERIGGQLLEHEFMTCKIRHPRDEGGRQLPFSVYLGFRAPQAVQGREVIFAEGRNDGKLIAHEGGFKGRFIPTVHLEPTSALAMRNNKYPITEIGIRTLTQRLIEKGERDKQLGPCSVRVLAGAKVKDRVCTCVEVKHPEPLPHYDFHIARVFMDDELHVPIRYEAFGWPAAPNAKPPVLEEYSYLNLKLNVGLSDEDFDPRNENYNF
jgi:hypothetical protein